MPTAFDATTRRLPPDDRGGPGLFISAVLHQGFIAVDEDGTEALRRPRSSCRRGSCRVTEPFHVDRPFLYVIHDVEHGTPLFLGRVLDPTAEPPGRAG